MSDALAGNVLSVVGASMQADMRRLEVVSHNLANATTPGFKREVSVAQPFGRLFDGEIAGLPFAHESDDAELALSRVTDYRSGSLRYTGNPLDVAIEGDGYLMLEGEEGAVYTRRGSLSVDAQGRLVGGSGLPVAGLDGEIVVQTAEPRIGPDGTVWDGEERLGQLRIVQVADPSGLRRLGASGFAGGEARDTEPVDGVRIRQAHLENSNVSLMTEMVLLIEIMRRFEASQIVVQSYDDAMEQTLRTIGDL